MSKKGFSNYFPRVFESKPKASASKGFFFAFIIFMLATTALLTSIGLERSIAKQKQRITEQAAFTTVNSRFENIYNEIITVKTGYPGRLQSRILTPFEYDSANMACSDEIGAVCDCPASPNGCGWIEVSETVPADTASLDKIYDALNLYAIFVSSDEISEDLNTTVDAVKNSDWGGSDVLNYLFLPQCVKYNPVPIDLGSNFMGIYSAGEASDGCTFDIGSIKVIEFSVTVEAFDESEPPNEVPVKVKKLRGDGDLDDEPEDPFDPANPNPYLKIEINIPNCEPFASCDDACCITDGYGVISAHVDPSNDNGFELQLDVGDPINFYILNGEYLGRTPPQIVVAEDKDNHELAMVVTKIIFDEPIARNYFNALDVSIEKPGFENLKRSTD